MNTPLQKKIFGMLLLLAVEFVFGMTINLWGIPPDEQTPQHRPPAFSSAAFIGHALLGLLLVGGAGMILIASRKLSHQVKIASLWSTGSILIAFMGGIATILLPSDLREISSFVMALGFLLSFFFYARFYYILHS